MAFKLKLAGASVAVALAVAVGTAAGNWLSRQGSAQAASATAYFPDPHQAADATCQAKGGLVVTKPATKGPLRGKRCILAGTDSPAP